MVSIIPPSAAELRRGPALLVIYWVQFSVALVFVILRFYARFSIRAIGLDDWAIAMTLVPWTIETNHGQIRKGLRCK